MENLEGSEKAETGFVRMFALATFAAGEREEQERKDIEEVERRVPEGEEVVEMVVLPSMIGIEYAS